MEHGLDSETERLLIDNKIDKLHEGAQTFADSEKDKNESEAENDEHPENKAI